MPLQSEDREKKKDTITSHSSGGDQASSMQLFKAEFNQKTLSLSLEWSKIGLYQQEGGIYPPPTHPPQRQST